MSSGFVNDEETGLYYLRSRYYQATQGRFLNADSQSVRNLFAYANSNPVCNEDRYGTDSIAIQPGYGPGLAFLSGSLLSSFFYELVSAVPLFTAITIVFTPTATANDEALWDSIQSTEAYDTLTSALSTAKEKGKASKRTAKQPTNIHHIVPKKMWIAQPARDILIDVGIDPATSPENLVEVSTQMHWFMHTNTYALSVNGIILFAAELSYDDQTKKTNVSLALSLLRDLITFVDQGS